MDYLFIDESGDLGTDSKYFIISAIQIKRDPKPLDKIIKKTRRAFKKETSKTHELKASTSSPEINKYILNKLNETDVKIFSAVLEKRNMYKINYNEDVNVLYNIIASKIAMEINLKDNLKVHIDRSKKPSIIPNFDKMFIHNLAIKNDSCKVSINHNLSHNYKGLQVVDCIAWSFFQEFENNNKEFTNLLKFRYKVIKVK